MGLCKYVPTCIKCVFSVLNTYVFTHNVNSAPKILVLFYLSMMSICERNRLILISQQQFEMLETCDECFQR